MLRQASPPPPPRRALGASLNHIIWKSGTSIFSGRAPGAKDASISRLRQLTGVIACTSSDALRFSVSGGSGCGGASSSSSLRGRFSDACIARQVVEGLFAQVLPATTLW